jgi:uncharacterized protein (TIGR02647 family)
MTISPDLIEELEILVLFKLTSTEEGIKVHKSAVPSAIAATKRLHARGFITQSDGGYLTSLGLGAAEHLQSLLTVLRSS